MYLNILFLQHTPADCPGCFWSWFLWMLSAFALGLGIGRWIWGKYALLVKEKNKKLKAFKSKNETLEKDFITLKYQLNEAEKDNKGLKASLTETQANIVALGAQLSQFRQEKRVEKVIDKKEEEIFQPITTVTKEQGEAAKTEKLVEKEGIAEKAITPEFSPINPQKTILKKEDSFASSVPNSLGYELYIKETNLKIIDGIGPKIEGILNKAGYVTWQDLANADSDVLQNIMHDAGPRYRIHSSRTWQQQIQLGLEKNWQSLIDFQQKLYAEKTNQEDIPVITKIEQLVAKKLGFGTIEMDDLKIIEGIGPKIESLLKNGHIKNWEDLAEAPLERIEKILEDGGDRFKLAIPSSWPIQAQYAIQHHWIKLKQYQEALINGQ